MKYLLIFLLFLGASTNCHARKKSRGKRGGVIVKYKDNEILDLGKLQIEGDVSTPTDILIEEAAKKYLKQKLYDRKHFKRENRKKD